MPLFCRGRLVLDQYPVACDQGDAVHRLRRRERDVGRRRRTYRVLGRQPLRNRVDVGHRRGVGADRRRRQVGDLLRVETDGAGRRRDRVQPRRTRHRLQRTRADRAPRAGACRRVRGQGQLRLDNRSRSVHVCVHDHSGLDVRVRVRAGQVAAGARPWAGRLRRRWPQPRPCRSTSRACCRRCCSRPGP